MAKRFHSNVSLTTLQAALAACTVLAGSLFFPATPAHADDVSNRLSRVEREIETLNRAVYKGETPPAATATSSGSNEYQASVEVRLSNIESQLRDLTGKIEQQDYAIGQMKKQLETALSDLDVRLSQQQQSQTAETTSSGTQTGTLGVNDMGGAVLTETESGTGAGIEENAATAIPAPASGNYDDPASSDSPTMQHLGSMTEAPGGAAIPPAAGKDPAGQYEMAFSLLKSGNYAASRNGFDQFLKQYPDHPLAPNALYWLGEDYYAEGAYDKATRIFAESYKKYPKGPKAPDSLLKLGMSLGKSGKSQQACITLQQIKKEFPSGSGNILRAADQEIKKMSCAE